MMNEQPKQPTVTEATEVGKNCGACTWWQGCEQYDGDGSTMCWQPQMVEVVWDWKGMPTEGTKYPPGRSWCPVFEAME